MGCGLPPASARSSGESPVAMPGTYPTSGTDPLPLSQVAPDRRRTRPRCFVNDRAASLSMTRGLGGASQCWLSMPSCGSAVVAGANPPFRSVLTWPAALAYCCRPLSDLDKTPRPAGHPKEQIPDAGRAKPLSTDSGLPAASPSARFVWRADLEVQVPRRMEELALLIQTRVGA